MSGEVRYFQSTGGSGKSISRGFCPACGSPLFGRVELLPDLVSIRAGTLDEPAIFQPSANLYVSHAAPWDHFDHALKAFAENAPGGR